MITEESTLNRAARAADAAVHSNFAAMELVEQGDTMQARQYLDATNEHVQQARRVLVAAGARIPDSPQPEPVPMHLLDTVSTRQLLNLLRGAVLAAERVDAERGHVLPMDVPLLPGESRGTGWAETISNLAETLRQEIEGPRGRGEGT